MRTKLLFCAALAAFGCTELTPKETPTGSSSSTGGAGGEGGGGFGGGGQGGQGAGGGFVFDCSPKPAPEPPAEAFCERIVAGAAGQRFVPVDLSAAHAGIRFFAPITEVADADQALAAALLAPDALETLD